VGTQGRLAAGPLLLFGSAIFLSAWLLFQIQPMFAKMALPLLGGAPAVWNTALVFFQAALLLGYVYAHFLGTRLPLKLQVIVHLAVLAVAFIALPVAVGAAWREPPETTPVAWLIGLLAVSVGLPFFALSATSPLLQRWFGETGHDAARDPYFLYGASNLGSLLALVAYPLLLEPGLALADQSALWTFAYVVLAIAIGATGCFALHRARRREGREGVESVRKIERPTHRVLGAPDWRVRLDWVMLAFVPSGLLVAVTTLITTDLVAVPLFWVIPLTLYLLSFTLVFARKPLIPDRWMIVAQAPLLVLAALMATWTATKYHYLVMGLMLASLFVTAMVCHGRLVQKRPPARHLTEFYVWMSLGGILGSAFAALLAPLLFSRVIELAILCAAAAFLRPRTDHTEEKKEARFPIAATAIAREISFPVVSMAAVLTLAPRFEGENGATALLLLALVIIFAIVFTMLSAGRPLRFGLCVIALAIFGMQFSNTAAAHIVYRDRTFFGTHVIKRNAETGFLTFYHGSTLHGAQHMAPARYRERHTYYHAGSGMGRAYAALAAANKSPKRVGAIGLGAGEIACYRADGQDWTFFEIDPAVVRIAASGEWFRYLPECAPKARIVLGDGRLTLAREPAAAFDLLVLDAFASDSIPSHLVTREAFRLYFEKLAPDGVILVHISNRYIDLEPLLAALAADAKLAARLFDNDKGKRDPDWPYRYKSTWIALARSEARLKALTEDYDKAAPSTWGHWRALKARPGLRVWTDNYSNIVTLMK
jgi:SAM-dependent methyltransferase